MIEKHGGGGGHVCEGETVVKVETMEKLKRKEGRICEGEKGQNEITCPFSFAQCFI